MRKQFLLIVMFIVGITLLNGCASGGITGKNWMLLEVYVETTPFSRTVIYDRNSLRNEKIPDTFTLTFNEGTLSGVGAPTRYSAPYTEENGNLKIEEIRATLMAPLIQPEKLQESVYFGYLQNAASWSIVDNKLEIKSKTETGADVRLIFEP